MTNLPAETNPDPGLGWLVIELNIDTGKMGVRFTNPSSVKLVHPQEIPLLFSPVIMGLILDLLRSRSKSIIVE